VGVPFQTDINGVLAFYNYIINKLGIIQSKEKPPAN